jgi:predicted DNA-binding transcriptional regulator YafY
VLEALAFTAPPGEFAAPETVVLLAIADAVRHQRPMSIRYTAADGRRSERSLHPYGLVAHSGRWYVTGADPKIGAVSPTLAWAGKGLTVWSKRPARGKKRSC